MAKKEVLIPLGYRVILTVKEAPETSKGGIHLPPEMIKQEQDAADEGHIVRYGDYAFSDMIKDKSAYPPEGTKAFFVKYGGKTIEHNGEKYRAMNDDDLIAMIGEIEVPDDE